MWLFCLLDPGQIRYRAIYTHSNQIPGYASLATVGRGFDSVALTQVWKRRIAEGEERLAAMNRAVEEKMAHQQRLVDKLQQFVRVQDNLNHQREAAPPSRAVANGNNSNNNNTGLTGDDDDDDDGSGEMRRQPDALSARLDVLLISLKAMTAGSVQVCRPYR